MPKYFLSVVLSFTLCVGIQAQEVSSAKPEITKMPEFPGGETALYQFINSHLKYPSLAAEYALQDKVVLELTVNTDGTISDIRIVKGKFDVLNAEALRVAALLPSFKPGMIGDSIAPIIYSLPIRFKLMGEEENPADAPHSAIAGYFYSIKDYALKHYLLMLEENLSPESGVYLNIGKIYHNQQRLEEACKYWNKELDRHNSKDAKKLLEKYCKN